MRLPALLSAFLFASAALAGGRAAAAEPVRGDPAPPALGDSGGKPVSLLDYRGQVVVVTFWKAACAACIGELSSLESLQTQLAAQGLQVIAVNLGDSKKAYGDLLRKKRHTSLVLAHDAGSSVGDAWDVHMFPNLWIVGRDGRIVAHHEDYVADELPGILAEVQRVVAAQGSPAGR
jgi:peroxiredoxin